MKKLKILSILKFWLPAIFSILISVPVKAQILADFKADIIEGCAPVVINFTDLSKGNPKEWLWDLGNGIISTQKNPGTFYFDPGSYTISLRVVNGNDTQTVVKKNYIIVNSLPEINFALSDSIGCFPFGIRFSDLSLPKSGDIKKRRWDFGDGGFSNDSIVDHIYNVAGNFTISLILTNTVGCTQVISKPNIIKVLEGVTADFSFGEVLTCNAPVKLQFNSTSKGKNIQSYKWNFGDGTFDSIPNPTHTYKNEGLYGVGLTILNANGCSDSIYKSNIVSIGSVSASFTGPLTVCQNNPVSFVNTSQPVPTSVIWNFGDGSSSVALNPTKNFASAGTFKITLIIFFNGCSDTITHDIKVLPLPNAGFTTSGQLSICKFPLSVNFKSNDSTLTSYQWNFGDGITSKNANPTYLYSTPGLYNVSLNVIDSNGCTNGVVRNNLVYFGPPVILQINGMPYRGCAPFETKLSAQINTPEPIASYLWNFGDSTTSTEISPSHFWEKAGNYSITLTIITVNGCTTTFRLPNGLVLTNKPVAGFTAAPQNTCALENIKFSDSTIGIVTKLEWFFGDGATSTEKNTIYKYKDTGSFTITLVASNDGCFDTLKIPKFIYVNPPVARYNIVLDCATPFKRQFVDSSVGAISWVWNFGDNTTSTEQNPVHVFPGSGLYNVELKVTNGVCQHTVFKPVLIIDEKPVLIVNNASKCKGSTTRFIVDSINESLFSEFIWDFGDGNNLITKTNIASYNYTLLGTFNPSVKLIDKNGCIKFANEKISITVIGPDADFSIQPQACIQSAVIINNLSKATAGVPISNFIWDYGDGYIDTLISGQVQHNYNKPGNFDIKLTAIDAIGCKDVVIKQGIILVTQPKASFIVSDSIKCVMSSINFSSTSTGESLKYLWNFGDGTQSVNQQVIHKYNFENSYDIKLVVTDAFGCADSLLKTNAIRVANAKAALQTSDSISSCPPFIANLVNRSTNYSFFYWDFNDGTFSNLDTPSHYFFVPGVYKIKLIANGFGCSDTAITTVTLRGPSGTLRYDPLSICFPGIANFIGSTPSKVSFIWDYGDGAVSRTSDSLTTHVYINPGKYKPKLLLVDGAGCQVPIIGKDTITISKPDAAIKSISALYCDSSAVQFYDSSQVLFDQIKSYEWNFDDGSINTTQNPMHVYRVPGIYNVTLKIKTRNGCTDTDTMQTAIKIIKSPSIKIVSDMGVCQDKSILFKGQEIVKDTSVLQWSWNFGNGETSIGQYPAAQVYHTAGSYKISATAINSSGCRVSNQLPFEVYPTPNTYAGKDTALCLGNTLLLQPAGANTYRWGSHPTLSCLNCATPLVQPITATTYKVEGTSAFGCKSSDTIRVGVTYPFKATTNLTDTLCVGEAAKLVASGSDIYKWSPAAALNNASLSNPVATPNATTTYQVIVSDKYQCFADTGYVKIVVYPIPKFNIEKDEYLLSVGNSVLFKTTSSADITSYKWTPYIGLSCINCPQPTASPRNTTEYFVKVLNDGGCKAEDKVTVTVICNNANIFIPNTFSPNGDGMNDIFFVRGKGIAAVKAITIFNRWGIVVFQKTNININDPLAGWDGTYNSTTLTSDVFVYKVDIVCENNQVFSLKGNVTLIK